MRHRIQPTRTLAGALLTAIGAASCATAGGRPSGSTSAVPPAASSAVPSTSVWSVDLMRTRPGQQARYLRYLEANWARYRRVARAQGAIGAYEVLVLPADSGATLGWDVALLTEYPDSAAFARAEAVFAPIMAANPHVLVDGVSGGGPDSPLRTTYRFLVMRGGLGLVSRPPGAAR